MQSDQYRYSSYVLREQVSVTTFVLRPRFCWGLVLVLPASAFRIFANPETR